MAKIMRIDPLNPLPQHIKQVVEIIEAGGVVIYPTETLYGIGANPFCPGAVQRVYRIKGREASKSIPFLIKDLYMLTDLVEEVPPLGKTLIERYWPGPLTLIFWAKKGLPFPLHGKEGKLGLRISSHPIARMISQAMETPLTSTSANPAGGEDLIDIQGLCQVFGNKVDLLIDGGNVPGIGSTVVDLTVTPPKTVREGILKGPLCEEV